jgi:hypothetical protein
MQGQKLAPTGRGLVREYTGWGKWEGTGCTEVLQGFMGAPLPGSPSLDPQDCRSAESGHREENTVNKGIYS